MLIMPNISLYLVSISLYSLLSLFYYHYIPVQSTINDTVVNLSDDNFSDFITNNKFTIVNFYRDQCPYCEDFEPEYEQLPKQLIIANISVPVGKVNYEENRELASKYNITGVPTILFFESGKNIATYLENRKAKDIVSWIRKIINKNLLFFNNKSEFIVDPSVTTALYGYFKSNDSLAFKAFNESSLQLEKFTTFYANISDNNNEQIFIFRRSDNETLEYNNDLQDPKQLEKFVRMEYYPLFGPLNTENYQKYEVGNMTLILLCANNNQMKEYENIFKDIAKDYRGIIGFVAVDAEVHGPTIDDRLGITRFPSLFSTSAKGTFVMPGSIDDLKDKSKIKKFVDDVVSEKAERFLKSQEIPETNNDIVRVVVGESFEKEVFMPDKDCILKVYVDWCVHCKQIASIYEEAAKEIHNMTDKIVFAEIRGDKNDPPTPDIAWQSYPTIFYFKAGTKTPITFEGERSVQGIISFIKQHSSFKFTESTVQQPQDEL